MHALLNIEKTPKGLCNMGTMHSHSEQPDAGGIAAKAKAGYIQISRLLLDNRSSEPRDEIQNILLEIGIFSNMKLEKELTIEEIRDSISNELGLEMYPLEPLRRAADRLVKSGRVVEGGTKDARKYSLAQKRRDVIGALKKETSTLHESVSKKLLSSIESAYGKLESRECEEIEQIFDLTVSSVFAAIENTGIAILLGKPGSETAMSDVRGEFGKHVHRLSNPPLERIVKSEIRKAIVSSSSEMQEYMTLCASNSFMIKILNLDPECQSLQRSVFSTIKLYLDTNIMISALFPSHELHGVTCEVLRQSRDLGVEMLVTSRTLEEFKKVTTRSDDLYSKYQNGGTKSRYYVPEHVVIESFVRYASPKGDTWDTYLSALKQTPSVLEKKYSVRLDQTDYGKSLSGEEISELSEIVWQCSMKRSFPKSEEVAEHDAYHFLLIDYLRQIEPSKSIWFLSHDTTFDCVNEGYFRLEGKTIPCSMFCSSWFEILFPFMSPDVSHEQFETVFTKIVASDFFSMGKTLSFGSLTKFFAPFFNDEALTEEDYAKILQDQILKRLAENWRASGFDPKYDDQITETIARLVDKRKDARIAEMLDSFGKQTRDNELLQQEIAGLMSRTDAATADREATVKMLKDDLASLKSEVKSEKERTLRRTRIAEVFIVAASAVMFGMLMVIVEPSNIEGVLGVVGLAALIGGLMLGAFRWFTKQE